MQQSYADTLKIPESVALYINLVVGCLTAVANGAAFLLTVIGRQRQLAGDVTQIILWFAAGLFLVISSSYALAKRPTAVRILRAQTFVILLLLSLLILFGLSILVRGVQHDTPVSWDLGVLSLAALYGMALASTVFDTLGSTSNRRVLLWGIVSVCVLVDIGAFVRVGGML